MISTILDIPTRDLMITEDQPTSVNDAALVIYVITGHVNLNLIQYVKFDLLWSVLTST